MQTHTPRSSPKRHVIYSTEEAYALCQTSPYVHDGDTLHVPLEGVVALAWTWPVAVTLAHGALHRLAPDGQVPRLLRDMRCPRPHLAAAVRLADRLGYPVDPRWRTAVEAA